MIVIDDLAYPMMISNLNRDQIIRIKGGKQNNYDNRAVAIAVVYADGAETFAVAETSVEIGRDLAQAQGFVQAQSFD